MAKNKQPKNRQTPTPAKKPSQGANNPGHYDNETIAWRFALMDHDGPWGWHKHSADDVLALMRSELALKETTTWHNLRVAGSHNVAKDKLIKDARDRLEQLNLDDLDELFSLRLNGKKRVWGIKDRHVLKILWYDPEHEVCPAKLSHT